jgi:uroporphyrin-III C-methyltransferase/precorrin-2 dehydrogenase/sirohydrochlorin ferrochelatase
MTPRVRATRRPARAGLVSLVGAGPGDPDLLTYRAIQRLRAADLVLYDGLVPLSIVRLAASARHVSVSKRAGAKAITQDEVSDQLVAAARRGERVVRLKSGDPFVLGRGGEEVAALAAAGIPCEVVPGVTSAVAAPALAGIPVTHRGVASGFVVVSGHAPSAYADVLGSLAPGAATIVVLMGMAERAAIGRFLVDAGWPTSMPAALVACASQPDQRVWVGAIGDLGADGLVVERDDPGVIVIGDVVSLATPPAADVAESRSVEENPWPFRTTPRL